MNGDVYLDTTNAGGNQPKGHPSGLVVTVQLQPSREERQHTWWKSESVGVGVGVGAVEVIKGVVNAVGIIMSAFFLDNLLTSGVDFGVAIPCINSVTRTTLLSQWPTSMRFVSSSNSSVSRCL